MNAVKRILLYPAAAVLLFAFVGGALLSSGSGPGLRIVYIDYANNQDEVAVLFNASPSPVDLTGYRLTSEGGQGFIFVSSTVNPQTPSIGAYDVVRVHVASCLVQRDPRDFNWVTKQGACYKANVWNDKGDKAILFDPRNVPVAEYSFP